LSGIDLLLQDWRDQILRARLREQALGLQALLFVKVLGVLAEIAVLIAAAS
jgi:hypothetical protein